MFFYLLEVDAISSLSDTANIENVRNVHWSD